MVILKLKLLNVHLYCWFEHYIYIYIYTWKYINNFVNYYCCCFFFFISSQILDYIFIIGNKITIIPWL